MTKQERFNVILSKNHLARQVKFLYKKLGEPVDASVLYDFREIEKVTGVVNLPTAENILTTNIDI